MKTPHPQYCRNRGPTPEWSTADRRRRCHMGDKYKINGDRKMPRVGQEDQLSGYRVWPRANGFTGRAQNSPPAFTPQGQRASDKALTLIGSRSRDRKSVV